MAMDHSELIAELPRIEKLTAAERLKLARDRRIAQLSRHEQIEREFAAKKDRALAARRKNGPRRGVRFIHNVMLLEAAARNDIEEVRRLLMHGVSPDSTNEDGLTALHQCCIDDSESMMKLLLEFGANVNAEDSEKWTPLHAASTCGHLHLVKYLISKGANLLSCNADGNMPYDICEDESTLDYIESEMARRGVTQELIDTTRASTEKQMLADLKELAQKGVGLEFVDTVGATPLHIAEAANGYISVVEFLLDQHVSTDYKDSDGWQPIHGAACWGHLEILELLVQNGSDLNAQTNNQETPYDICEDPEMKQRIAALRTEQESRAKAEHQKNRRSTSLSTNTRSHSIRRNSTRDKGQITKKATIKNEAIKGIQQDELPQLTGQVSSEDNAEANVDCLGNQSSPRSIRQLNGNSKRQAPPPPSSRTESAKENGSSRTSCEVVPHFLSSPSFCTGDTIDIHVHVSINALSGGSKGTPPPTNVPPSSVPLSLPIILPTSPLPPTLHSMFSSGPCTLSDLKKQRSHSRIFASTSPDSTSQSCVFRNPQKSFLSSLTAMQDDDPTGRASTFLRNWPTPTEQATSQGNDPTDSLPIFQGETEEKHGASKIRESSCCVMS